MWLMMFDLVKTYFQFEFLRSLHEEYIRIDLGSIMVIVLVLLGLLYILVCIIRSVPAQNLGIIVAGAIIVCMCGMVFNAMKEATERRLEMALTLQRQEVIVKHQLSFKERQWNSYLELLKEKEEARKICLRQQPEKTVSRGWISTETVYKAINPLCNDLTQEILGIAEDMKELKDDLGMEPKREDKKKLYLT